jgi:hypothetical protein
MRGSMLHFHVINSSRNLLASVSHKVYDFAGMRGKLYFEDVKSALCQCLICPSPLEAEALLARLLPTGSGPFAELSANVLLVEGAVWRFKRPCDALRVAELMESYFRIFDPEYRIRDREDSPVPFPPVSIR